MKRTALTLALLLAIFVSLVGGMQVVKTAVANPYPYANCDSSFVAVSVVSPENTTYDSNSILLNITVGAYLGIFLLVTFLMGDLSYRLHLISGMHIPLVKVYG